MLRNLFYNFCPILGSEDISLDNVRRLERHWATFNGRKVVVIKTGQGLLPPEAAEEMFERRNEIEFLRVQNDEVLHEVAGFVDTLRALYSLRRDEATFYAHNKGAGHKHSTTSTGPISHRLPSDIDEAKNRLQGIRQWRNTLYDECLTDPQRVDAALSTHAFAGCFLFKNPFRRHLESQWCFAGTFWWFRHDVLYASDWDKLPGDGNDRWGTEDYLGQKFPVEQAFSFYGEGLRMFYQGYQIATCRCGVRYAKDVFRISKRLKPRCVRCRKCFVLSYPDRLPATFDPGLNPPPILPTYFDR